MQFFVSEFKAPLLKTGVIQHLKPKDIKNLLLLRTFLTRDEKDKLSLVYIDDNVSYLMGHTILSCDQITNLLKLIG
jgi:hypothetical protein